MDVKERDYLFDNLKLILIFLVILGHMTSPSYWENPICGFIYYLIYGFHMPLFIFITGYFSKNLDKARDKACLSTLLPFIIFNTLYALLFADPELYDFFRIQRTFWFLFCIGFWKLFLKDLVRIKFIVPISIGFALFVGLFDTIGTELSLSRLCVLLPFFLLGYFCQKEDIEKIRKLPKWFTCIVLLIMSAIIICVYQFDIASKNSLQYKWSYHNMDQTFIQGIIFRLALMIIAAIISICVINLVSRKQYKITKWGKNTLAIYISHTFAIQIIRLLGVFDIFQNMWAEIIVYVIASVLMVFLFGSEWYNNIFAGIIKIVQKILIKPVI